MRQTEIDKRGLGFYQSYSIGAIAASANLYVPIAQTDIDRMTYFNAVDIVNKDVVDIDVYLDGDSARAIRVPAANNVALNESRFRSLLVVNRSGTTGVTANAIVISIQKYLDRRGELEARGL